jgi:hypothetical protein
MRQLALIEEQIVHEGLYSGVLDFINKLWSAWHYIWMKKHSYVISYSEVADTLNC